MPLFGVGPSVLWINPQGFIVVLDRALMLPKHVVGAAPVVVGLRNARVEPDRLVEVLDRALVLVKIAVRKTPPVVGLVHFRIAADRFVVIGNRLLVPPGFLEP